MDWKPERAIQAKVRDFQNKDKKKSNGCWGAPMEEHSTLVYKWQLLPDFESTMGFVPKRHQLLPSTRFYPVCSPIYSQKHHLQGSLPSVCTTMSVYLPSSSSVICNYTVVRSSTVHTVIQITFIHSFIQLYIHTLILSHINTYTTYTQYQFIHGCISHPSLVWPYPFVSVFKLFQAVSPKQWTAWVYLFKLFRAVSPKQWIVRVYFYHIFERSAHQRAA